MGRKDKTVSFRIREEKFEALREIADDRDISLSEVFRDYVDMLIGHDGQVEAVPKHQVGESPEAAADEFPTKVEVPTSYVREHERMELEVEHLREQLAEYEEYTSHLREQVEQQEQDAEEIVRLEEIDQQAGETVFLG
jgi:hypothetical protein